MAALVVASVIIFAATEALPGDYATASLGQQATPELVANLRAQLGLNESIVSRYADWASGIARGDFGKSYTGYDVWTLMGPRLLNSLALAFAVILFSVPLAITIGILTGLRSGGVVDGTTGAVTLMAISLPEFVVGLILAALFGIIFPVLPATSLIPADSSGFAHPDVLVLPAIAAASVTIGYIARMTRAATLDVLDSEYIRAAQLRGISGWPLITRHVLRNALIPAITIVGNQIAWMLTGLVAVELVFVYPGIGSLLVGAISTRDAPLIGAISLVITAVYIAVNLLTDLAAALLNPRLGARG